jgi:alpha-glucosidase
LRWVQTGVFLPRFSIHSCSWKSDKGSISSNEPWMYPNITNQIRDAIKLRVQLRPLLFSLFVESNKKGYPIIRPLFFHYQEEEKFLNDSFNFLLGKNVLIVPIFQQISAPFHVFLPQNETWFDLDLQVVHSTHSGEIMIDFNSKFPRKYFFIPFFLRKGGFFVLSGSEFTKNLHSSSNERIFYVAPSFDVQEWYYWEEENKKIFLKKNHENYSLSETDIFTKIKIIEITDKEGKYQKKEIEIK